MPVSPSPSLPYYAHYNSKDVLIFFKGKEDVINFILLNLRFF